MADKDKAEEGDIDDLFDEFVLIDRDEINQKLNFEMSKEKLDKEE